MKKVNSVTLKFSLICIQLALFGLLPSAHSGVVVELQGKRIEFTRDASLSLQINAEDDIRISLDLLRGMVSESSRWTLDTREEKLNQALDRMECYIAAKDLGTEEFKPEISIGASCKEASYADLDFKGDFILVVKVLSDDFSFAKRRKQKIPLVAETFVGLFRSQFAYTPEGSPRSESPGLFRLAERIQTYGGDSPHELHPSLISRASRGVCPSPRSRVSSSSPFCPILSEPLLRTPSE